MAKKKVVKFIKFKPGVCPPEVLCTVDSITNEVVDPATLTQCPETIIDFSSGCAELTAVIEGVGVVGDCVNVNLCRVVEIDCITNEKTITTNILFGNDTDITESATITECPQYMLLDSQEVCVVETVGEEVKKEV